jgi:hypothetical protein
VFKKNVREPEHEIFNLPTDLPSRTRLNCRNLRNLVSPAQYPILKPLTLKLTYISFLLMSAN